MHHLTSNLILFSDLPADSILLRLSGIYRDWQEGRAGDIELTGRIYREIKRLLDLATTYGFDENLWQNYLTYLLLSHENSFSLTCEMRGATEGGSINLIALREFEVFRQLFHFDFAPIEKALGIDCFSALTCYRAIPKKEQRYNRAVSERVRGLSRAIAGAAHAEDVFRVVVDAYRTGGVGVFGMNRAFRVREQDGKVTFLPINNIDAVRLDDLIGYDLQKKQLRDNIEAFVSGRSYNNMLLYGDAGTGKSTSVKALLNEYGDRGLRIVEIYKHQFGLLSEVIQQLKQRAYRFLIFLDDLSFEETEVEYKFLKAVIEGGIETRPDNVLICATSNRRHLVQETWKDRNDMEHDGDIHRSDTMQEKLSLAARFGCAISYSAPDRRLWAEIVKGLAERCPCLSLTEEQLMLEANRWELRHGGISGRTAQQFINHLAGQAHAAPKGE